ncbi:hypothetical protein QQ045_012435 [Rhodiola kirilowii]
MRDVSPVEFHVIVVVVIWSRIELMLELVDQSSMAELGHSFNMAMAANQSNPTLPATEPTVTPTTEMNEKCDNVIFAWLPNLVSKEIGGSIIHCNDSIHAWNTLQMRFVGANTGPLLLQLHKEIVTLVQGTMDAATYHGSLFQLWGEVEALDTEEL